MSRFIFAFLIILQACSRPGNETLKNGFINPPEASRPGAFWCWLNGNMTRESITRDLEEMKTKGMNRAEIWDVAAISNPDFIPAGGPFLGNESVELIRHAVAESRRLNMRIGIIASSGWNAGGSWVTAEWASKSLFFSETEISGPGKISVSLKFPKFPENCPMKDKEAPVFYKDVAVVAVPLTGDRTIGSVGQVVDLTTEFRDGKLEWEVPAGKWTILRFVCSNNGQRLIVPSPKSDGLFIDFFDPEATKRHLQHFLDRIGVTKDNPEAGPDYYEFDSMELSEGIPWTDSFDDIFSEKSGYSLVKYLPILAGWKTGEEWQTGSCTISGKR